MDQQKTRVETVNATSVGPHVGPSDAINELLSVWSELDETARRDLLAVARGWVASSRR